MLMYIYVCVCVKERAIYRESICTSWMDWITDAPPTEFELLNVNTNERSNRLPLILYVHTKYNIASEVKCILFPLLSTAAASTSISWYSITDAKSNFVHLDFFLRLSRFVKNRVTHLLLDWHNDSMIWINLPCHCHYAKHKYTRTYPQSRIKWA